MLPQPLRTEGGELRGSRGSSNISTGPDSALTAPGGALMTPGPWEGRQSPSSLHAVEGVYCPPGEKPAEKTTLLFARPGDVHIAVVGSAEM